MRATSFFDERYHLEVFVDYDENLPTVEIRLPSMASVTPEAALRFGEAIIRAAIEATVAAEALRSDDAQAR